MTPMGIRHWSDPVISKAIVSKIPQGKLPGNCVVTCEAPRTIMDMALYEIKCIIIIVEAVFVLHTYY